MRVIRAVDAVSEIMQISGYFCKLDITFPII